MTTDKKKETMKRIHAFCGLHENKMRRFLHVSGTIYKCETCDNRISLLIEFKEGGDSIEVA